jgi:hypothetical protein
MGVRAITVAEIAIVAVLLCSSVLGQHGIVRIEKVDGLYSGSTVYAGNTLRFVFRYVNDVGYNADVSNGFRISSPDGAVWDSVKAWGLGSALRHYDSTYFDSSTGCCIDSTPQWSWFGSFFDVAFGFGPPSGAFNFKSQPYSPDGTLVGLLGAGSGRFGRMPKGWNDTSWSVWVYFHDNSQAGKTICIDSGFYPPGGEWLWVDNRLNDHHPEFQGLGGQEYSSGVGETRLGSGYCFTILDVPCESRPHGCPCCAGMRGNVNMVGGVDLSDLSMLVGYLTGPPIALPCAQAANLDGSGTVDLTDLSALVNYLTGGGYAPMDCF